MAPPALVGETARFVENGAGTYTYDFKLPAGSTLYDIVVTAEALWTAGTAADLIVGNADDPDGFIASTSLKATDLTVGQSISIGGGTDTGGGKAGADAIAGSNTHIVDRYSASEYTIQAKVVATGTNGTAGRTRVTVVYIPAASTQVTQ